MRSCDLAGGVPGETLSVYKATPKTSLDMGLGSELRTKNRSEEHTSELQSPCNLVCRLLLEKKKKQYRCTPLRGQLLRSDPSLPSTDGRRRSRGGMYVLYSSYEMCSSGAWNRMTRPPAYTM